MSTTEYQYSIGLCQFTTRLRGGRTLDKPALDESGTIPSGRLVASVHVWVARELHGIFSHRLSGLGRWGSDDGSVSAPAGFFLSEGLFPCLSFRLLLSLFAGLLFLLGFQFGVFLGLGFSLRDN